MENLINPYEARTTMTIDRANRLHALKGHPGFQDLIALSQRTVDVSKDALVNYAGWDKDELVARSIAFRAAVKSHEMLFVRMAQAIQEGIEEAMQIQGSQATPSDLTNRESADMADELRALVLQQIDNNSYDTRVPGTY